ncbi:MAG: methyl-accepting chemotaxis protein [Micavibrio sp.]
MIRKSLSAKIISVLLFVTIISLGIMSGLQIYNLRENMVTQFTQNSSDKTDLLATQFNGGFKWKKANVFETIVLPLDQNEKNSLAGVLALNADGSVLYKFSSERFEQLSLEGLTTQPQNEQKSISWHDEGSVFIRQIITDPKSEENLGTLLLRWDMTQVQEEIHQSIITAVVITAVITIFLMVMMVILLQKVVITPLQSISKAMSSLSSGDSNVVIPYTEREDQIGSMGRALKIFARNTEEKFELERQQKEAEARMQIERKKHMHDLANSFDASIGNVIREIQSAIGNINQSSTDLREVATAITDESHQVLQSAQQSAENTVMISAASEELSATVGEISQQMTVSKRISSEAVHKSSEAVERITQLEEEANKIGNVINMISEIAEQTNLLALNATIEAARAGDAGKGFAVVASEVKNLATQTSEATGEITKRIHSIVAGVNESVQAIQHVNTVINEIDTISTSIAAASEEQSVTTQDISSRLQENSGNIQSVTQGFDKIVGIGQKNFISVQTLEAAAETLQQSFLKLKEESNSFVSTVKNS